MQRSVPRRSQWLLNLGLGVTALYGLRQLKRALGPSFRNRTVVITGGSRGLGLVLARQFAREGAKLVLLARNPQELAVAEVDLTERGASVLTVTCDITDQEQVRSALHLAASQFGGIDVLVNNAGRMRIAPFELTDTSDFRSEMDVHFWGSLFCAKEALPYLKKSTLPRIINITSIGGRIALPHLSAYNASKFAAVALSRNLRAELKHYGIKVTTVFPGPMRTGSIGQAEFKGDYEGEYRWFAFGASIPGVSVDVTRIARQVVEAARYGRAELVFPTYVRLLFQFQSLFPGLMAAGLSFFDSLLPVPTVLHRRARKGAKIPRSAFTDLVSVLSRRAAIRNNQI